jgi:glycine/D-amino acid oxidase-like deaminating enzyme
VAALLEVARRFAGPDWAEQEVKVWQGVMPLSPDDFPIIGRTARSERHNH